MSLASRHTKKFFYGELNSMASHNLFIFTKKTLKEKFSIFKTNKEINESIFLPSHHNLLKVSNGSTTAMYEICSKLTIKTSEKWLSDKTWTYLMGTIVAGRYYPAGNHMLKVNNWNTRTKCEICLTLTLNICRTFL